MQDSPPIRILTVDDHQLLREGFAAVLEGQPDMVLIAQASGGREAIERFREHRPDVTLMDLRMPDMSGIGLTQDGRSATRLPLTSCLQAYPGHRGWSPPECGPSCTGAEAAPVSSSKKLASRPGQLDRR
jgi:CheY-like chemotaxis protein